MWRLDKSRKQFFVDCGNPEENFWKTLFEQSGHQNLLEGDKYSEFLSWNPHRSNCPELDIATKNLLESAPVEWMATMRNIFVARSFKGDVNAEASSFRGAGIIELNYGFTLAAMIYSTLFSHFYDAIRAAGKEVDWNYDDTAVTEMIVEELERAAFEPIEVTDREVQAWAVNRHVKATHPLQIELPKKRTQGEHHNLVLAIEEFVIGHEYCHHMLGHTDSAFRHAQAARGAVADWLDRIGWSDFASALNEDQVEELEADVGSFLLLSGVLSGNVSRSRIYRAVGGSMLGLVALSHANDTWLSGGESHPDFLTRYEVMYRLIKELVMDMPIGVSDGHPMGFLIQIRGFISAILQTRASNSGGDFKKPNFLNVFSWMIDQEVEFKKELKSKRVI